MKNAYLIVTDIHDHYCNTANRIDYVAEIDFVRTKIVELGKKYKDAHDNVYLILLGDIFKGSFNEPDSAVIINNFWIIVSGLFSKIYCVLGNHETSYYTSNPFFTLVQSIESQKVRNILNRNWTPKGLRPIFNVVDTVEDGNVIFHFNHYGTPINRAIPGKTNIGLFHQDIICQEILDLMSVNYRSNIFQKRVVNFEKVDIFDGFSYNFFGHLHKVYGTFECTTPKNEKTILCYLASLGRPNVTEVNDLFLERDIPAVIVNDGNLSTVESNTFNLMSRSECVKEDVVKIQQKVYEKVKQRKAVREYKPHEDNPILNIKNCAILSEKEKTIFLDLLEQTTDRYTSYIVEECRKVLSNYGK